MSSASSLLAVLGVGVVLPVLLVGLLRLVGPRPGPDDRPLGPPGAGLHTGMLGLAAALAPLAVVVAAVVGLLASDASVSRGPAVVAVAVALVAAGAALLLSRARGPVTR